MDPKIVSELSRGSSQASDGEIASGGPKSTPERKTRRAPGRQQEKKIPEEEAMSRKQPLEMLNAVLQ